MTIELRNAELERTDKEAEPDESPSPSPLPNFNFNEEVGDSISVEETHEFPAANPISFDLKKFLPESHLFEDLMANRDDYGHMDTDLRLNFEEREAGKSMWNIIFGAI